MSKVNYSARSREDAASYLSERAARAVRPLSPALVSDGIALAEAAIIVLSAWLAKIIYLDSYLGSVEPTASYVGMGAVLASICFFVFRRLHLYAPHRLQKSSIQTGRIFLGLATSFLVLVAFLFLVKEAEQFSRGWMLLWFAISFAALAAERSLVRYLVKSPQARGGFRQRVAIYGASELGKRVRNRLASLPFEIEIVGVFDDRKSKRRGAVLPVEGGLEDLVQLGQKGLCDQIVIAVPTSDERIREVVGEVSILPVDVRLCPEALRLPCHVYGTTSVGGLHLLDVHRRPMTERDLYIKAAMDYLLAGLGLLALLPLFPLVAIAIKVDSKGPVFFRQRRHGFNHQIIRIFKFRTMTVLEDGPLVKQACKDDARITRVGRFLRMTNLDELPQLLNVLRGEMSLVGPRPHALAHNEFYGRLVDRYATRLRVKPGISGWAQVNGFSGETSNPDLMRRRVEHDLYYIENWSVWLDIEIIFRTLVMALAGRLTH